MRRQLDSDSRSKVNRVACTDMDAEDKRWDGAHLLLMNLLLRKVDLPPLVRGSVHCIAAMKRR